jgi:hypothetical protein
VTRPGVVTLMEMVATARTGAGALTSEKVGHLLTGQMRGDLDRLLVHDAGLGMTRLTWLTTPAVEAISAAVKMAIEKLLFLRGMDAHHLDLSMLPRERRRFLATLGRRSTVQGLERRGERRYPILLALVAQSAVDQLDEVIVLFDQAVSARESRAKARTDEALAGRARKGEARQLLMDVILPVLIDVGVPDEDVGGMLRTRIGMGKLREVAAVNWKPLPRDHGRLAALEASYSYLRQFTPHVLTAIDFQGGPGTGDLMDAVEILKDLNRAGGRKVPAGAPVSFVPARYADYLAKARKSGDETAFRHYWEMCTVLALRDGLRSGDVFVPGSRRYADPGTYLFTPEQWQPRLAEFCQLVRKPPGAAAAIAQVKDELHLALTDLEETLADSSPNDVGAIRLDQEGKLVIPPLSAEDIPAEAKALRDELASMLPFVPIASLLIELDARTNFLACFTHAGGRKSAQSVELKRNILAVLIAGATNLGLTRMSEACGVFYDTLAWTQEWYVREDTLRDASTVIVTHHYGLELARKFGGGTMSSSDGQRFPVRGKSLTGRDMVIHGGRVLSTYTHVSDQWSTYGTKQIVATHREGHYTLDELLGNETDLPIREHATDTHGVVGELRVVRPGRQIPHPADPRSRQDHPGAGRLPGRRQRAVPARRAAAGRPVERGPGGRVLPRPAAHGRVAEVRGGDRVADRREVVGRLPPEHPRGRAQGMGPDAAHYPRRPLPVRPGLPQEDLLAAQQGREPPRAPPRPALRPAGHHRPPPPPRPDRTGLVPHPAHELGDLLDHRVLRHGHR